MKKRNYTLTALLALLVVGSIQAQYTTKIIEKEKTIISTSTPVQAEAEVKDNKKDNSSLKRFEFGGRYLPVISSIDIRQYNGEVIKGTLIFSQGAGVILGFNVSPNVGIEANVNYYAFNQKYKDEGISREVSINYVDIPVLLSLNTSREKPVNLNLVAGPQFGLNFGSKVSGSGGENADTECGCTFTHAAPNNSFALSIANCSTLSTTSQPP